MTKFTLPHSEAELQAQRDMIASLEASLKATREALQQLVADNYKAQRAEDVRKARILTAKDREILTILCPEGAYLDSGISFTNHRTTYRTLPAIVNVPERQFDKLHLAGYLIRDCPKSTFCDTRHIITDAGRKALDTK